MKKSLSLLLILTLFGCNEDPEINEDDSREEAKKIEFRFQQGKLDRNMLRTFISTIESDYAIIL